MMALSHHGSVPRCLTDCNTTAKSTLPSESTHSGTLQSRSSLPNGTQAEQHPTILGQGTVDLTTGLAYIPIWFDPDLAFQPV